MKIVLRDDDRGSHRFDEAQCGSQCASLRDAETKPFKTGRKRLTFTVLGVKDKNALRIVGPIRRGSHRSGGLKPLSPANCRVGLQPATPLKRARSKVRAVQNDESEKEYQAHRRIHAQRAC
jgi:hypothetical protein